MTFDLAASTDAKVKGMTLAESHRATLFGDRTLGSKNCGPVKGTDHY